MKLLTSAFLLLSSPMAFASMAIQGAGFTAPTIKGTGNVQAAAMGDIVFDYTAGGFYGLDGTQWSSFDTADVVAPSYAGPGSTPTPANGVRSIRLNLMLL